MTDVVNHPDHYTQHPSGVECIQIAEWFPFNVGNAIKYLWRATHKNGLEDLKKAAWYVQREIQRLSPDGSLAETSPGAQSPAHADLNGWEWNFIKSCQSVIAQVHQNAVDKGWWEEERNDGETLALIHSEISEVLEALRAGNPPDDKVPTFSKVETELADVIIRVFDYAGGRNLRVAEAIIAKMRYNKTRGRKHGKLF